MEDGNREKITEGKTLVYQGWFIGDGVNSTGSHGEFGW
jgi:hypothetical protein